MNRINKKLITLFNIGFILSIIVILTGCKLDTKKTEKTSVIATESPKAEYFLLRPEIEKMYGYTQAVKVGNIVKIGGVMSLDEKGNPLDKDNFSKQIKNCYVNLEKVLKHYGCTFDDVVLENIYTTSMQELHKNASYRHEIYKTNFPTGSWIGIKELGLPGMMIEIEMEVLVPQK